MPRVRLPQSDTGRVHLLATSTKTAASDNVSGLAYLPAALVAQVREFVFDRVEDEVTILGFASLVAERAAREGRVAKETAEAQAAGEMLETTARDFISALVRRTFRMKHNVAVLDFHDLDHDGAVPPISSREDRRTLAQQLINGDAAAVANGFPAMSNPGAAELQTALANADREAGEVVPMDRDLQKIVEKIREERPRAIELVDEVLEELRHATRKLEEGTARDIMRSYGVTFEALPGETPEPTPA